MQTFLLPYGENQLTFELPSTQAVVTLKPRSSPKEKDGCRLVDEALGAAVATQQIESALGGASQLHLIVPDKTRNCGASAVIPVLLEKLNQLEIRDSDCRITLALGSHAKHVEREIEKLLGAEVLARIAVEEHDCHSKDLVFLGETKFGTPVFINKDLTEAERIVIIGTAVHHYFAGYGGGPKMINPGCAGYETIRRNHALSIDPSSGGLHPNCRSGVVSGNPIQEDIQDSLRFVSADLLIETILDEKGEIAEVFVGELLETHYLACKKVDELYKVEIEERADLVVVSCGGYPKDVNLIQAHKSLNNAFQALKEGGTMLVLAECRDGLGSQTFMDWFDYPDRATFLQKLQDDYTLNGTTALSLRTKAQACNLVFVSRLLGDVALKLGVYPANSLDEGWRKARSFLPESFSCYVMPNGSLTVPYLNDE